MFTDESRSQDPGTGVRPHVVPSGNLRPIKYAKVPT